jgi:Na+-driven multidrug efflux pump
VTNPAHEPARFVTGSLLRHVVVMAGTSAIGLVAVFAVDLLNLFYISLLGQRAIAAAIGFAGAVGFFQISLAIGMTIGTGAVVSRCIGAGRPEDAGRIATASLIAMAAGMLAVGLATIAAMGPILDALGAAGETRALAAGYLTITAPSLALLAVGMGASALLRCVADPRRAMNVTLAGAMVTACCDPLLIFGLHLDLTGAAISTVLSRATLLLLGLRGVTRAHRLLGRPEPRAFAADLRAVMAVAGPAILTNLATPVGAAFVTRHMAAFGPDAVAGQATIDRITPVAFGLVYALSGAVGPILAQNLGAGLTARLRETLRDSLLFVVIAVLGAWAILAAAQDAIVFAFSAKGMTADLVHLFCTWLAGGFLFTGALFVGNAAFNNLGFPLLSTAFNWGRATLGTIPFVAWGAQYGPLGVQVGQAAGSLVFGVGAAIVAFRVVGRIGLRIGGRRDHDEGTTIPLAASGSGSAAVASFSSRPRRVAARSADR